MKKDEFSFFEIFQDPLMTIIALVLLGTVWMIFPGESKSVDPATSTIRGERDSFREEIERLEEKLNILKLEYQKLFENSRELQRTIDEATGVSDAKRQHIDLICKKIKVIEDSIKEKREELNQLENELQKIKELLNGTEISGDIESIRVKMNELTQQIERKHKELTELEENIKELSQQVSGNILGQKRSEVAGLQNELKTLQEDINKLKKELEEQKKGTGYVELSQTQKKPFYIELANNQLFPVDEEHYEIKYGYLDNEPVSVWTRKSHIQGESVAKIQVSRNRLYELLKKYNPDENRAYFLVHADSFEIYRKAKKIAQKERFEITWWPYERDSIVLTHSSSEGDRDDGYAERPGG